ncbi:MAG: 3-phosphoshikimate 1-carboxyvinyltransferase [Lachnospiraceae bacterium]|nr:3-phosphoshikimate 1-carboxyvinyltransferase [Lachnospiraceae bacterium]
MRTILSRSAPLRGEITVPGDKSISHRAVMLGSIAKGTTEITGFLSGADCLSTVDCFRRLGVEISVNEKEGKVTVCGRGMRGLRPASDPVSLYTGNSGTTTRIISGILAPQPFTSVISGDASIATRPMRRIMQPLSRMGAHIESVNGNDCAPLRIEGRDLHGITYHSPVASAQVKSSILCAGLYAEGVTEVVEPSLSRDHTERMLRAFGAEIDSFEDKDGWHARTKTCPELEARRIHVPGDISSAAYFIAAASLIPGSEILIRGVGINPTRAGMIEVAQSMGADISILGIRQDTAEPIADLLVRHAPLHGVTIGGSVIPALIDEIPVLAVMAACAEGTTYIKDAAELKVKETDRIDTITKGLSAMGCSVVPQNDGMIIEGNSGSPLTGSAIKTYGDHRIAMAFSVAALAARGETVIDDEHCVDVSYPGFYRDLDSL